MKFDCYLPRSGVLEFTTKLFGKMIAICQECGVLDFTKKLFGKKNTADYDSPIENLMSEKVDFLREII